MMSSRERISGSFRDPSGEVFTENGVLYRSVNESYRTHYDTLMQSGLYDALVKDDMFVPHVEVERRSDALGDGTYKIIKPEKIPFISYPYEWCFSQLKDAALLTLATEKQALSYEMTLKDASAYNVQFRGAQPVWIDTLSFERYQEGRPWVAYQQFCRHFLAPLALVSFTDMRLSQLAASFIDGIPLDLASSLLPWHTRARWSLLAHIHLHAASQKCFSNKPVRVQNFSMNLSARRALIESLEFAVSKLRWKPHTEWADYRDDESYSPRAFEHRKKLVRTYIGLAKPKTVFDLGANTGEMSRIAQSTGAYTVALDGDSGAVEKNYLFCKEQNISGVVPLRIDLTNPTPAIGWEHAERMSFTDRAPADMALALALVHHLAISNNVPLERIAHSFATLCDSLAIEFVPKSDPRVKTLLQSREDIFPNYTQPSFEKAFRQYFTIMQSKPIQDSERTLYYMQKV